MTTSIPIYGLIISLEFLTPAHNPPLYFLPFPSELAPSFVLNKVLACFSDSTTSFLPPQNIFLLQVPVFDFFFLPLLRIESRLSFHSNPLCYKFFFFVCFFSGLGGFPFAKFSFFFFELCLFFFPLVRILSPILLESFSFIRGKD